MAKELPITQGMLAIVDDGDYDTLAQFSWQANFAKNGRCYAECSLPRINKYRPSTSMHRMIMQEPDGLYVDHIDNNGLNNTRTNLRICTNGQNNMNAYKIRNGTSKYKGVSWCKKSQIWRAFVCINGKSKNLGNFKSEIEAAYAYDKAAMEYYGEFARPNVLLMEGEGRILLQELHESHQLPLVFAR